MVEVAGIEPETPCAKNPVTMQDSEFSVEALIKILTNLTDADRQILTRIVKRWGNLIDELKRAVLRVVG